MSSSIGNRVRVSIFGQSHGEAIGVLIDGLPAGERIDTDELQAFLERRRAKTKFSTPRREPDAPEFLSGLVDGVTCGAPLCAVIRNTNQRSGDYGKLRDVPRPGHADFTARARYGDAVDLRGGGHFSGRLTAPLCIAGGIAKQILARRGVTVGAHIEQIAGVRDRRYDPVAVTEADLAPREFPVLDPAVRESMEAAMWEAIRALDSVGGVIECAAVGLPAGLGDPMFDGVENRIAKAVFGIPAVKGVEFGAGFGVADLRGSENNDLYYREGDAVKTRTNNHGGALGGITSGMPLIFRAAFKPTASIKAAQETLNLATGEIEPLEIGGRHDPCIVLRAAPCVESAAAITLLDLMEERG